MENQAQVELKELYAAKGELVDKIERMQYQLNQVNIRINQVLITDQPKNEPKA